MQQYLPWAQIIISVILIVLVLLQQRGTALGSSFGQDSGFYTTKRGLQKNIFWATVVLAGLFIIFALLNLLF
jgi:preprotein translocase subunit SecG